tara:strand:+ start:145035 stop:145778 length:744 start_codon:yes stop_codon:yes gene_type:complete
MILTADKSAFLYLDEMLDKKEPIYVRNVARYMGKRGIVVVTLNDGHRSHRETIPNTRHPVCLSAKVTPAMIANSKSLRELLDGGSLELVPREVAEKELSDETVQEELAAAYKSIGLRSEDVMRLRRGDDDFKITNENGLALQPDLSPQKDFVSFDNAPDMGNPYNNSYSDDIQVLADAGLKDEGASPRIVGLVEALSAGDMKAREVKSELVGMELSEKDLAYLIANASGIVANYAKEKFARLEKDAD